MKKLKHEIFQRRRWRWQEAIAAMVLATVALIAMSQWGVFSRTTSAIIVTGSDSKTSEDGNLIKTATMSADEKLVSITLETELYSNLISSGKVTPKVLFMQGSVCTAHGLTTTVIIDGVNSLLEFSDVDYAFSTDPGPITSNGVISFKKGTTVSSSDLREGYSKVSGNGIHRILGTFLSDFRSILENNTYDMIVILFDGYFAANGVSSEYSTYQDDLFYVANKIAALQADNSLVYLLPDLNSSSKQVFYDYGYDNNRQYFANGPSDSSYNQAVAYFSIAALIDPTYWLTQVDSSGNYIVSTMPEASSYAYPNNVLAYSNSSKVSEFVTGLQNITAISLSDTLIDGLTPNSVTVQKYNSSTNAYETITSGFSVSINGQTVTVDFDEPETDTKIKVTINATAEISLGYDGKAFPTNDGEATVKYKSGETVVFSISVDSPMLQKERQKAQLVTHHYLLGTTTSVAADDVDANFYWYDSYETAPSDEALQNYLLVEIPADATGTINADIVEVVYYYAKPTFSKSASLNGQSADDMIVAVGSTITYTIAYNNPTSYEYTIIITDYLPEDVSVLTIDNGGVLSGGTIVWTLTVAAYASGTVSFDCIITEAAAGGKISNSATIEYEGGSSSSDPTYPDDSDIFVLDDPTKTVLDANGDDLTGEIVIPGTILTYRIELSNPADEPKIFTVTDPLPDGITLLENTLADNAVYDASTRTITWVLELAAGESKILTFQASVNTPEEGASAQIKNQAFISVDLIENRGTKDPNSDSDSDSDCLFDCASDGSTGIYVVEDASQLAQKSVYAYLSDAALGESLSGQKLAVGDNIVYQIVLQNPTSAARTVSVADPLPKTVNFISADNDGSYDRSSHTVSWEFQMDADSTVAVTVTVSVDAAAANSILRNSALITFGALEFSTNEVSNYVDALLTPSTGALKETLTEFGALENDYDFKAAIMPFLAATPLPPILGFFYHRHKIRRKKA